MACMFCMYLYYITLHYLVLRNSFDPATYFELGKTNGTGLNYA